DGKWIAYFSDEPGEYELQIRDQNGFGKVKHVSLGTPPSYFYSPTWSPDSKWIAYAKQLPSHLRAVYVYSLDQIKAWQVTDGMSDAMYPVFDKDGKNLYFTA